MNRPTLQMIRDLIAQCTPEEQETLFRELRQRHKIHAYEEVVGVPAEMILEAIHRAPELTRRMLRGVIADAAFSTFVTPAIGPLGWRDITPEGNFTYDYMLDDGHGAITIQVKLQRSERGQPAVRDGARYGFPGEVFIVETQKTRTGTDVDDNQTRPYRYGEFDVLAVSMQPSCGTWDRYKYTVGRWLLPGKRQGDMATIQPVSKQADEFWTNDYTTAAAWFRAEDGGKCMKLTLPKNRK